MFQRICHGPMVELTSAHGERIFHEGDPCLQMMFLVRGFLTYHISKKFESAAVDIFPANARNGALRVGHWLSEAVLWLTWVYCGDLCSNTPSVRLCLSADAFCQEMQAHPEAIIKTARYARWFVDMIIQ